MKRVNPSVEKRTNLILIHGISETTELGWFQDWVDLIPDSTRFNIIPVSWEHQISQRPRRKGSIPDLIGDIRALYSPGVDNLIQQALEIAYQDKYSDRTWVMGHSLGSALAHQTLLRYRNMVSRLITFGCPLFYLYYFGLYETLSKPVSVRDWFNVYGLKDPITGPFYRRLALSPGLDGTTCDLPVWSNHSAESYFKTPGMRLALLEKEIQHE